MTTAIAAAAPDPSTQTEWMTLSEVARAVGCSESTVRYEKLPITTHRTSGGHRRFLRDEVLALVAERRRTRMPANRFARIDPAGK